LHWLATHLLAIRMGLNTFGGLEEDNSLKHFLGKNINDIREYPQVEEILDKWNTISPKIQAGLEQLSEQKLGSESPVKVPVKDTTLGGYLGFLMHHEAYHIGQMGILRKYTGNDAMSFEFLQPR